MRHSSSIPQKTKKDWLSWDGDEKKQAHFFAQAGHAESIMLQILLGRLKRKYMPEDFDQPYYAPIKRAWLLELIEQENLFKSLWYQPQELSNYIFAKIEHKTYTPQSWQRQHPFVASLPIIGQIFKVPPSHCIWRV